MIHPHVHWNHCWSSVFVFSKTQPELREKKKIAWVEYFVCDFFRDFCTGFDVTKYFE